MNKEILLAVIVSTLTELVVARSWHGSHHGFHSPEFHHQKHWHESDISYSSTETNKFIGMVSDRWNIPESSTLSEPTTLKPSIETCFAKCIIPPYYDPVCGTNNVTYKNYEQLRCARLCGVVVAVRQFLQCPYETDNYFPMLGNRDAISEPTINLTEYADACINLCTQSSLYSPVCGSNNVTYNNMEQLQCAQLCGVDVNVQSLVSCEFRKDSDLTESTTSPLRSSIGTAMSPNIAACIRFCPTTPEFNPICGTNNVTYNNPGQLYCAQICGVEVGIKLRQPCPRPTNNDVTGATTPVPDMRPSTQSPIVRACLLSCPVTSEFNPVCGTNDVTYNNPGHLECAKYCGVDVSLKRSSRCPSNPSATSTSTSRPAEPSVTVNIATTKPTLATPNGGNSGSGVNIQSTIPPNIMDMAFTNTESSTETVFSIAENKPTLPTPNRGNSDSGINIQPTIPLNILEMAFSNTGTTTETVFSIDPRIKENQANNTIVTKEPDAIRFPE